MWWSFIEGWIFLNQTWANISLSFPLCFINNFAMLFYSITLLCSSDWCTWLIYPIGDTSYTHDESNLGVSLVKEISVLLVSTRACFCKRFISRKLGLRLFMAIFCTVAVSSRRNSGSLQQLSWGLQFPIFTCLRAITLWLNRYSSFVGIHTKVRNY